MFSIQNTNLPAYKNCGYNKSATENPLTHKCTAVQNLNVALFFHKARAKMNENVEDLLYHRMCFGRSMADWTGSDDIATYRAQTHITL